MCQTACDRQMWQKACGGRMWRTDFSGANIGDGLRSEDLFEDMQFPKVAYRMPRADSEDVFDERI